MLLNVYSVPGIQASKVNRKHSLPSKSLQSNGKVGCEISHFQFGGKCSARDKYCRKLSREESKVPLQNNKYFQ